MFKNMLGGLLNSMHKGDLILFHSPSFGKNDGTGRRPVYIDAGNIGIFYRNIGGNELEVYVLGQMTRVMESKVRKIGSCVELANA